MAIFTTADRDAVKSALITAATEGVASVSIGGHAVQTYNLDQLTELLQRIVEDLAANSTTTGASGGIRRRQFTPYYP